MVKISSSYTTFSVIFIKLFVILPLGIPWSSPSPLHSFNVLPTFGQMFMRLAESHTWHDCNVFVFNMALGWARRWSIVFLPAVHFALAFGRDILFLFRSPILPFFPLTLSFQGLPYYLTIVQHIWWPCVSCQCSFTWFRAVTIHEASLDGILVP